MSSVAKKWKQLEQITHLDSSVELKRFMDKRSVFAKADMEKFKKAAEDLVDFFKDHHIPKEEWITLEFAYSSGTSYKNILRQLLLEERTPISVSRQRQCVECADIFAQAGASIFMNLTAEGYIASAPSMGMIKSRIPGVPAMGSTVDVTTARGGTKIWVRDLFARKNVIFKEYALRLALKENDSLRPTDFIDWIAHYFKEEVKGSSKTSAGILGAADQKALACSQWILKEEAAWIREAKKASPTDQKAIKDMLKDAHERVSAKNQAVAHEEVDPVALKKAVTLEQKDRIKMLHYLIYSHPKDSEAIAAMFKLSPWLAQKPALAAIQVSQHKQSLMTVAMNRNCLEALKSFEKWGVNLWLAAAQDDMANPIHWLAGHWWPDNNSDPQESASCVARLMLKGAWLSGEKKPKEHCVTLAQNYIKSNQDGPEHVKKIEDLMVCLEKEVLEEVIASIASASNPQEGATELQKKAAPKKVNRL